MFCLSVFWLDIEDIPGKKGKNPCALDFRLEAEKCLRKRTAKSTLRKGTGETQGANHNTTGAQ